MYPNPTPPPPPTHTHTQTNNKYQIQYHKNYVFGSVTYAFSVLGDPRYEEKAVSFMTEYFYKSMQVKLTFNVFGCHHDKSSKTPI